MVFVERVTVHSSRKGGVLARTPEGARVIVPERTFRPIAELPSGRLVLSATKGTVVEETAYFRHPSPREVLVAWLKWYEGKLYAVAWNFARHHDNAVDAAAQRAGLSNYEPIGTRVFIRAKKTS